MSATILQMVLRKRAAKAQAAAALTEREQIIADAKGEPGLRWRGKWVKGDDYLPGDAVEHAGSSYIATQPSAGQTPKLNSGFWDVLALKGKDGKAGANGRDGGVVVAGRGGGSELSSLQQVTHGAPQSVAVKVNGQWVQMKWSAFLSLLPTGGGLPANTATVDGEAITVDGEYVTVNT